MSLRPTKRRDGRFLVTVRAEFHVSLDDLGAVLAERLMQRLLNAFLQDSQLRFDDPTLYDRLGEDITALTIERYVRSQVRMYGDNWLGQIDAIFDGWNAQTEHQVKAWAHKRIRVLFPDWPKPAGA